jgi:hypothetical protein
MSNSAPSHDALDNSSKFVTLQGVHNETASADFDISTVSALSNETGDYDLSFLYDFQFDAESIFAFPEIMAYSDMGYAMAPQPIPGIGNGGRYALGMFSQEST